MNDLIDLINSLDKATVREFLAFAKTKNKRHDVLNIKLFHLIKTGEYQNLDLKLYGKPNKNALYALKKRLQSSIIEFLAFTGFENDQKSEMTCLRMLLSARLLLERGFYTLGYKTLQKAERLAHETDLFSVLHEVYLTFLQYAHRFPKVSIDRIQNSFKFNKAQLDHADQIALLFSTHKTSLAIYDIHYYRKQLARNEIRISSALSFKNLYELLEIFTDLASLDGNYNSIRDEVFAIENAFSDKKVPISYSGYFFDLRFLLALSYFRISNFNKARGFLSKVDHHIRGSKERYQNIKILQSLCLNYTGHPEKAIGNISDITNPTLYAQCVLAMFYLQQEQPQDALRQLNKLNHRDSYYEKLYSKTLVLQKNVLLLLIYVDLDNINLIESQITSLRKKSNQVKELKEQRISTFLKLVTDYHNNRKVINSTLFKKRIEQISDNEFPEDVFAISFYAWLKSKVLKKPLYEITLELVST